MQFTTYEPSATALLDSLRDLASAASASGQCVAFGEIGLDYDRLQHSPKEVQLEYFAAQLDVAANLPTPLPLFLHSRAAATDFARLLRDRLDRLPKRGVVHSFTGTKEEMEELVEMGFDIGINGCSLKTEENIAVARAVPLERLQIETDGPWCEMRPSHASAAFTKDYKGEESWKAVKKEKWVEGAMVKGRNEPCCIGRVAWALAGIKGCSVEEVAEAAWKNSVRMFGLGEDSV
jgi:TatD DNase family protein